MQGVKVLLWTMAGAAFGAIAFAVCLALWTTYVAGDTRDPVIGTMLGCVAGAVPCSALLLPAAAAAAISVTFGRPRPRRTILVAVGSALSLAAAWGLLSWSIWGTAGDGVDQITRLVAIMHVFAAAGIGAALTIWMRYVACERVDLDFSTN